MALTPLQIAPGLHMEDSEYSSKGRYVDGENIRFWKGLPEKIGGSQRMIEEGLHGPARSVTAWAALNGTRMMAFGSACRVELLLGGALYDITPAISSGQLLNAASSIAGSKIISIRHDSHGLFTGQTVHFGEFTVGGIMISGYYTVAVIDNDTYSIEADEEAVENEAPTEGWGTLLYGSGSFGGSDQVFDFQYLVLCGDNYAVTGTGFGDGTFSAGPFSGDTGIFAGQSQPRIWSLDGWGENLVLAYRGSTIFEWVFADGVDVRAQAVSGAPAQVGGLYVSDQDRILVALGATDLGGTYDPMLIRWCDQEDNTNWIPAADNYAGDKRCEIGSEIIGSVETRLGRLILTDQAAYLLTYIGLPFVYSLTLVGTKCGLSGPNAIVSVDGIAYWMSNDKFFMFDGAVRRLYCPLQDRMFEDAGTRIDPDQRFLTYAGQNSKFDEIIWFYAEEGEIEVSAYISFTIRGQEYDWSRGSIARTSWIDSSEFLKHPVATLADGTIAYHEVGNDNIDLPIAYHYQTCDIEMGNGDFIHHVSKMVPDFKRLEGEHTLEVIMKKYPQGKEIRKSIDFNSQRKFRSFRARGRTIAYRFSSNALGNDFRLGLVRFDAIEDGAA